MGEVLWNVQGVAKAWWGSLDISPMKKEIPVVYSTNLTCSHREGP